MPRPYRIESSDALYHVTDRGVLKSAIVRDDHDRIRWTEYLKESPHRFGLELYAYALMDNHYHLFLSTPRANLGKAMQYLNGSYAAYFNARHERKGHLFEKRYHSVLIETQGHYTEISRYIHLNPVRASLVEWPEQYLWSSYHGYHVAKYPLPWLNYDRVLAEFADINEPKRTHRGLFRKGDKWNVARERYREFVADGVGKKLAPPWARAIGGWILGSPAFVAKTYAVLAKDAKDDRRNSRAVPGRCAIDATLDDIAAAICKYFNITPEQLKSREFADRDARRTFAYLAREQSGHPLKSIGERLGLPYEGTVRGLVISGEKRMAHEVAFRNLVSTITTTIKPG